MKWIQLYLVGYAIVLGGIIAALWKVGVLERIGPSWTVIAIAIAVGVGFMIAVANSGAKESVEIDQKR